MEAECSSETLDAVPVFVGTYISEVRAFECSACYLKSRVAFYFFYSFSSRDCWRVLKLDAVNLFQILACLTFIFIFVP
jgi:hypothetical protein